MVKRIYCKVHGSEAEAIMIDYILIRYCCKHCLEDKDEETKQD